MSNKEKIIARFVIVAGILFIIGIWFIPTKAFAYEGNGDTYSASDSDDSSSTAASSKTEKSEADSGKDEDEDEDEEDDIFDTTPNETLSEIKGELNNMAEDMSAGTKELFNNSDRQDIATQYKTPGWITKITTRISVLGVGLADLVLRMLLALSGVLLIHGAAGTCFTNYYNIFKDKKYSFFLPSVVTTRKKYGLDSADGLAQTSTTTTTGTDGKVTQNVVNTVKNVTGPMTILVSYTYSSAVVLVCFIILLMVIKFNHQVTILGMIANLFGQAFMAISDWFMGIVEGSL